MEQCGRCLGGLHPTLQKGRIQDLLYTGSSSNRTKQRTMAIHPTLLTIFIGVLKESVDTGVWDLYVWMVKDGLGTPYRNGGERSCK